jgi:conjugative transfer signal peptidase TraF
MTPHAAFGLAGAVAASALLLAGAGKAGYRLNTTSSMPAGIWHVSPVPARLRRGMIVVACLPAGPIAQMALRRAYVAPGPCASGTEPLLKPIAAVAGDVVEVTGDGLVVNGAAIADSAPLARDDAGRTLPAIPIGAWQVLPSEVWLVSDYSRKSFDSRYFGGVPIANIQAAATPIWVLQ